MPVLGSSRKRRLIVIVSVLLTVGFLATSLISYFVSTGTVRQDIAESSLPLTSDNIYSEIQRDLLTPVLISSLMAHDTYLRDWATGGEKDIAPVKRYLAEIKRKYSTVTSFFVSEKTRTYYHAGGILKKVEKDSWRDVWYFRLRDMKAPYEINVDPDMANKDTMTIFINYRMLDDAGAFLGAVGVGLTVSAVRQRIAEYHKRYNRQIYFVDPNGKVMLAAAEGNPQPGSNIHDKTVPQKIASEALSNEKGSFQFERDKMTVLLNTRFIPELGWTLFVEQDETSATGDIRRALFVNLGLCLVVTLIVVAVTAWTINAYQSQIEAMAITDKLTGALNRHGFEAVFAQAIRESERDKKPLSVLLLDADHFKQVNDRHGHLAGDTVLRALSDAARSALRSSDVFCRWGGEEFLVLLKDCTVDAASKLGTAVCERVRETTTECGGEAVKITVSVGVAQYRPGETSVTLVNRVDQALFDAKRAGRNRVMRAA